ncbi:MAG: hypothetical protein Q8R16_04830 [bacterium]|nr:hypothetical protein [bacterium]
MAIAPEDYRPSSPEELAADSRHIRAAFEPKPILVPYEVWKAEIDALCIARIVTLATPANITPRISVETVEHLIRYQEAFYRAAYADLHFTIDRTKLGLTRERLEEIKAALARGEVNYPLVTCLPRSLSLDETGLRRRRRPTARITQSPALAKPPLLNIPMHMPPAPAAVTRDDHRAEVHPPLTLHRVLFDRLIRQRNIAVGERNSPTVDEFLEQVRDVTLADLARTDVLSQDGKPIAFNAEHWHLYLRALYRTLPRPVAQAGYTDLSFVAWSQDLPVDRVVASGTDDPSTRTIQGKSLLDAVAFRYPLISPSRYLALFGQYHAATGQFLDTNTMSRMLGIIAPPRPGIDNWTAVSMSGIANRLGLYVRDPLLAQPQDRLRCAR